MHENAASHIITTYSTPRQDHKLVNSAKNHNAIQALQLFPVDKASIKPAFEINSNSNEKRSGFDACAAGAFLAARWAAATAPGSAAVIYNAAPVEGDNPEAVRQARAAATMNPKRTQRPSSGAPAPRLKGRVMPMQHDLTTLATLSLTLMFTALLATLRRSCKASWQSTTPPKRRRIAHSALRPLVSYAHHPPPPPPHSTAQHRTALPYLAPSSSFPAPLAA